MALIVRWCCVWFSVFFLVVVQDCICLRHPDHVTYTNSLQSLEDADEVSFHSLDKTLLRRRRYLAAGGSEQDFNTEEEGDVSSSSVESARSTSTLVDNVSTSSKSSATPSNSPNASEPKTGGNYVAATKTTNTSSNNVSPNSSDINRTSQPQTSAKYPQSSTSKPVNQIPHMPLQPPLDSSYKNQTLVSPLSNSTVTDEDIKITKFPDDRVSNKTLFLNNITLQQEDHHLYYNSTSILNDKRLFEYYWVPMENNSNAHISKLLSKSHRRAATVELSFDFPFYGHLVRNVTIATGGFLYTGDYVHSWLAATQYIAPLMANFDTSLSNESYVKYMDNGTAFTVQWIKVRLQDRPDSGDFTFQATLLNTGDIVFVYQNVPIVVDQITDESHPVKVGLSDAYIIDRTIFYVRRKTIYEYHRVNFERNAITNWTVIYLSALPTCLEGKSCQSCLTLQTSFECQWCPEANRCSNGMDRFRQEWLLKDCVKNYLSNVLQCPSATQHTPTEVHTTPTQSSMMVQQPHNAAVNAPDVTIKHVREATSVSVSSVVGVLFLVALLLAVSLWMLYAYRNPHTASGQFLIKYRPSQWTWRRGEARYTAATIHM